MHDHDTTELVLHLVTETLWLLPIVYPVYFLLEWAQRRFSSNLLAKKRKPFAETAIASCLGLVPQCGFSAAAAALFNEGIIGGGALFAIFFATSDEAIPLLLAHPEKYSQMGLLLLCKFVFALLFGLLLSYTLFTRRPHDDQDHDHHEEEEHHHRREEEDCCCHHHHQPAAHSENHTIACEVSSARDTGHLCEEEHEHHAGAIPCGCGCCKSRNIFLSALLHTLKILGISFVSLAAVEIVFHLCGEELLQTILMKGGVFQPLLAALLGLIPGCGTSVAVTELYLSGYLSFGSCLAALSVGAGFGIPILLGCKVRRKEGVKVIAALFVIATLLGFAVDGVMGLF